MHPCGGWPFVDIFCICPWRPPIKTRLYISTYINIISEGCCFISSFFKKPHFASAVQQRSTFEYLMSLSKLY